MITKTALAQKFKDTVAAFAKDRDGKDPKASPYLKDVMVDTVYPLLAAAWLEGHQESSFGIPETANPYGSTK